MKFNKKILIALCAVCFIVFGLFYLNSDNATADIYTSEDEEAGESEETTESVQENVYVYICGEVVNPGVYELKSDSRLFAAVDAAGGFTEFASRESINLAKELKDGEQVFVPALGDETSGGTPATNDGLININSASPEELTALPGIGQSRAKTIVEYREKNGDFASIEDIMNVSGIKDASFQKIKDHIKV